MWTFLAVWSLVVILSKGFSFIKRDSKHVKIELFVEQLTWQGYGILSQKKKEKRFKKNVMILESFFVEKKKRNTTCNSKYVELAKAICFVRSFSHFWSDSISEIKDKEVDNLHWKDVFKSPLVLKKTLNFKYVRISTYSHDGLTIFLHYKKLFSH